MLSLGVAPASAATADVDTPNIFWQGVSDNALYINDAHSKFDDFNGMGVDIDRGFTVDAFDGFLFELVGRYNGLAVPVTPVPVSTQWVNGGLSTVVAEGYADFGNGRELFIDIRLEIQGNYARWTFDVSGLPGATIDVRGELGSDSGTVVVPLGATSLVTHDNAGGDPIVGYQVVGTGAALSAVNGNDNVTATFSAGGTSSLVVALQDYSPCTRDAAIAEMTARTATLATTFGENIGLPDAADCVAVASSVSFPSGTSTDQQLAVTVDPVLDSFIDDVIDNGSLRFTAVGLPAGLTLAIDPTTRALRLTGAAAAGSYDVRIVFYVEGGGFALPFYTTFGVTVGAAVPAAAPQLADSGADANTPYIAGAGALALLAGGLLLGLRRMRTRR